MDVVVEAFGVEQLRDVFLGSFHHIDFGTSVELSGCAGLLGPFAFV